MTQSQLNEAVSAALGEDVAEIQQRGFSLIDPSQPEFDPANQPLPPQAIDWDGPAGAAQLFYDFV